MRKITRNKRRTGSAIIQNGYYNGPRHWLLLNPPPLPGREAAFSFANSMVRALAHANGATGNLPEILTNPSLWSSLFVRSTRPLISRDLRRQPFLYYFLQAEGVGVSSQLLQLCTQRRERSNIAHGLSLVSCKILIIQKIFDTLNFKYKKMREFLCEEFLFNGL